MNRLFSSFIILWVALSVITVQPTISLAEWVVDGVPICTATGNQIYPQLVPDGSGGAIITWIDPRSGNGDIYAQRIASSGQVLWDTNGVGICTQIDYQSIPRLAPDGVGGAIIAWEDGRNGEDDDIYAQRVDSSGQLLWETDGVAISTASGDQWDPVLLSDGAGGAIIAWSDYRFSDEGDVYTQRVDPAGRVLWDTNGLAVCTATGRQEIPQIITDLAGGEIITWDDTRSGQGDIYAQRVDPTGQALWETNGVAICKATGDQWSPKSTSDGSGGAITAWRDMRSGESDIYAQRANSLGSTLWDTGGVAVCTASGEQWLFQLVSDGNGGAIITWDDQRGEGGDIYAQKVDSQGNPLWQAEGVPICRASGDQRGPHLVPDGEGGAIIAWVDRGTGDDDIYAQRVDANGSICWDTNGVAICTTATDQSHLQLISDGAGGAIITWQDERNGDDDIYAQRVDHNGNAPLVGVPDNRCVQKLPYRFALSQNYPNPFNATTTLCYTIPQVIGERSKVEGGPNTYNLIPVTLKVYNILGEEVRTLVDEEQPSGYYSVGWNGRDSAGRELASGIYFYRIKVGDFVRTKKMILLR